jgi:hypothetical protein
VLFGDRGTITSARVDAIRRSRKVPHAVTNSAEVECNEVPTTLLNSASASWISLSLQSFVAAARCCRYLGGGQSVEPAESPRRDDRGAVPRWMP